MPPRKGTKRTATAKPAESYKHSEATSPMRPEVGTQMGNEKATDQFDHQLSADNGLILVALLREQMSKFRWGNGASLERLKATRIMVPMTTDADGEPVVDWDGIEPLRACAPREGRTHDGCRTGSGS
jgi:hypothetical protein